MVFLNCMFGFQYITNRIHRTKAMSNMIEQKEVKTVDPLGTEGTRREYLTNTISFYKHILNCRSCSWNVSYSEHSGYLDVSDDSVLCPVYKDGKIESSKYLQYR